MRIDVVTIFPEFFRTPLETSMLQRAVAAGHAEIRVHDLRQYAADRHRTVDDTPFGGGGGMVMKPEPVAAAWEFLDLARGHCVYLTADGEPLNQPLAELLSLELQLVLLCGHYKGIDERARRFVDREVSVGDYVLTGGEAAALVLIDAVVRLIPGVLGNFTSALSDSFHDGLLDCPWYTRPAEFRGVGVPPVLLSGNHEKVVEWRRRQSLRRTFDRRPEILARAELDPEERRLIDEWRREESRDSTPAALPGQKRIDK
jgi:tRNA (guanine37-N1)-methyltransferase